MKRMKTEGKLWRKLCRKERGRKQEVKNRGEEERGKGWKEEAKEKKAKKE